MCELRGNTRKKKASEHSAWSKSGKNDKEGNELGCMSVSDRLAKNNNEEQGEEEIRIAETNLSSPSIIPTVKEDYFIPRLISSSWPLVNHCPKSLSEKSMLNPNESVPPEKGISKKSPNPPDALSFSTENVVIPCAELVADAPAAEPEAPLLFVAVDGGGAEIPPGILPVPALPFAGGGTGVGGFVPECCCCDAFG